MNFGEMVALIRDDLVEERLTNVQVQNAINQALKFYRRKTFYFNTIKTFILVTPGTEYYDTASIFLTSPAVISMTSTTVPENVPLGTTVGSLVLTGETDTTSSLVKDLYTIENIKFTPNNETHGWRLAPMMDATLENSRSSSTNHSPLYYSYAQMRIRVHPIPILAGTLSILATYMYPPFVEDTDTNVFLERADELIRQAAKRYLAFNNLHDQALGDRCAAMESEEFASLRAETLNREPIVPMRVEHGLVAMAYATDMYDIVSDR